MVQSDLTEKMKRGFLQAAVVSILLYGCTTWRLTERIEKKIERNYPRMLRAILNKSWNQHNTKQQPYGHLPPITKTIKIRRTRHAGQCCRSRDELISDVLLWTPSHGRAKAGRPARIYIRQRCVDTGCSPEDLPEAIYDGEGWQERGGDIMMMIFTQLYGFMYSYPILIILHRPIWPIYKTLKRTTIDQSWPGSNTNEGLLHTL